MANPSKSVAAVLAGVLLVLEAVALLGLTVWMTTVFLAGDLAEPATAIALVVMALLGVVLLGAFAFATLRGRSWGRSGGVVAQLLLLAVALGALTGAYADPPLAAVLAVPGVLGLVALFFAARAGGGDRA